MWEIYQDTSICSRWRSGWFSGRSDATQAGIWPCEASEILPLGSACSAPSNRWAKGSKQGGPALPASLACLPDKGTLSGLPSSPLSPILIDRRGPRQHGHLRLPYCTAHAYSLCRVLATLIALPDLHIPTHTCTRAPEPTSCHFIGIQTGALLRLCGTHLISSHIAVNSVPISLPRQRPACTEPRLLWMVSRATPSTSGCPSPGATSSIRRP